MTQIAEISQRSYRLFVGADIGHGDSCFVQRVARRDDKTPEEFLQVNRIPDKEHVSFPTILAIRDGKVRIGEYAIQSPADAIQMGFKSRPTMSPNWGEHRGLLIAFARTVREQSTSYLREKDTSAQQWIVGCPSGWNDTDRELYRLTFEEAGLPNVRIERESRAAMLYVRDEGLITPEKLQGSGVVVDIGSSTSDFTFIDAMEARPVEFPGGDHIGAGLIEKAILAEMRKLPAYVKLHQYLVHHPEREMNATFACRKLKEKYYRFNPEQRAEGVSLTFETADFDVKLHIEQVFMERVLDLPLTELDGKSWKAAYCALLESVRARLGKKPDFLVLTGGGSKMEFTRELAREVFGLGALVVAEIRQDAAPESTVARGLARLAHWDQDCREFERKVKEVLSADVIAKCIAPKFKGVCLDYTRATCDRFFGSWAAQCIDDWRAGRVKGKDGLFKAVNDKGKAWEKSADALALRKRLAERLQDAVLAELKPKIREISVLYKIPENRSLHFTIDTSEISFHRMLSEFFDTALGRGFFQFAGWFVDCFWVLPKFTDGFTKWAVKKIGAIFSTEIDIIKWFDGDAMDPKSKLVTAASELIRDQLLKQFDEQIAGVRLWIR